MTDAAPGHMRDDDPAATVVLQSFRTHDVPSWMSACMHSVEAWARGRDFAYERLDDAFFDLAPAWVRRRCADNLYAVTDVARLAWMRRRLRAGARRLVWADADLLVFAPGRLALPETGHGFARELFLASEGDGATRATEGVGNALMCFTQGDLMLERYWSACLAALKALPPGPVPRTALGPALLARLASRLDLLLIEGIALYTQAILHDLVHGAGALHARYLELSPVRPACANLCHFLRNLTPPEAREEYDRTCELAVARLLAFA